MNRDTIIKLANEVYGIGPEDKQMHPSAMLHLEQFATLVAAAEREACAAICEEYDRKHDIPEVRWCAEDIRARNTQ